MRRRRGRLGACDDSSLVWMLGSPRTGSTWLLNVLAIADRIVGCDEPGIGYHLSLFSADVMGPHPVAFDASPSVLPAGRAGDPQYFFSDQFTEAWREPLRQLVLRRFGAHLAAGGAGRDGLLVIKEPAGSQAAPFLVDLFPRSRLLFLARDGRDVVDSELDAVSKGGWLSDLFDAQAPLPADERLNLLRAQAHRWVHRMQLVQQAYDVLPPQQRLLVRYEDLRADTFTVTEQIFHWLGTPVPEAALRSRVAETAFEALPSDQRGQGRFTRAATPGAWRQSLTAAEQQIANQIMGPTLAALGYDVVA